MLADRMPTLPACLRWLVAALLATLAWSAHAEPLRLVTEPWAPFSYLKDGKPTGLDYEIAAEVFRRMNVEVHWQFLPWRRCLAMARQGQADAVLDIFETRERDSMLIYPSEPLSEVEFVLFQANDRPHVFNSLADLQGLIIGTQPGYQYSEAFLKEPGIHRETAPTLEANLGKLMLGRIDLVITDRRAGQYALEHLNLNQQISALPTAVSSDRQYLALRRGPGMEALAERFASTLRQFRREPAYTALLARFAKPAS
ncbi:MULTISPECIES: ABC transporter substrate-binding protein [unclassified Pseudomonas]|uniref:substrate-binding periplasmic protein n=1 Tax=unclassified Pseudomonas TaxID=196821 RepID=UPI000BDB6AF4|nr:MULTISPECIES: transporter substrate-binding domain-containing protein [unclassified Pseudomonas]PVZ15558.1 polar amino acid transport system substrate-binding protein [Pseudomonas sp. URIL14HWK12:I12]PVZ24932.1 polar amino acid transport system substrate-binding protein [Pseudomonas sp. URIL14HWK12:I10]PVZ34778.1 polar amino acid transport system substrate-binding protein [Pseudomonas sp. URIL14HWK12:I11]SNZ09270.1 amino acid ABC transporter substrate-binding protein, PAAT family (TC 3.A.1.3